MRTRLIIFIAALTVAISAAGVASAASSSTALSQVRAVYKTVLTAEYFGPASGVCSHLTSSGLKSYTAGGGGTCTHVFTEAQYVLQHPTKNNDDSGYTASQWRTVVSQVMAHLKVTVHGTHASAIGGQSGIPGTTTLVEVGGKWRFSSSPPSIDS